MSELGELALWAALPLVALTGAASFAGAWSGRDDLARLGGRSGEAAAALVLVSLVGLGVALFEVDLRYSYVAAHSSFRAPWPWRLAALWSGPGGGALLLVLLLLLAAASSFRLGGRSRRSAARTGSLAALAGVVLVVVARTEPFGQTASPALAGAGLPLSARDVVWQLELAAIYAAIACSAFAFAGIVAEGLLELPRWDRGERRAVHLAAALVTFAVAAALWRAYRSTGALLGLAVLDAVAVHLPAWLLAVAFLHAPGGPAAPAWAARWCRILGVALFPSLLGDGAALLAGAGAVPAALPWAAALAVGVVSGALAGLMRRDSGVAGLDRLPGYGPAAFAGGLLGLGLAGLAALWGLLRGVAFLRAAGLLILFGLVGAVAWHLIRPAGGWRRLWLPALALALLAGLTLYAASGWQALWLGAASGLAVGMLVGLAADVRRVQAAGHAVKQLPAHGQTARMFAWRSRRRLSSAAAHLGAILTVAGLAAGELAQAEAGALQPGQSLVVAGGLGPAVRVTYLGLSRYQVGDLDRQVASFTLYRGEAPPRLMTASTTFDWASGRRSRAPAVMMEPLRDVVVSVAGEPAGESVSCRLTVRPLSGLVWLGGLLLLGSPILSGLGRSP